MTLGKGRLALLAVVSLLIGLIAMFPARVAYQWAASPLISMSGLQGTVWKGSASQFGTNGVYLSNLQWAIRPLQLFTGKAAYTISGTPVSGSFDADIAIGIGGKVTVNKLTAFLPLQMLEAAANVPGLRGSASLQFERLEMVAGRPAALDGSIDVVDLVVPMLSRTSLGGFRAVFFTQDDGILASVEDTDGVVDLAGRLEVGLDGSYAFLGKVKAKPTTPDSIANQLKYLPPADVNGQHELRLEGSY